jgi:hypothetical protein
MKSPVLLMFALLTGCIQAQVTFSRLLHASQEPQNWTIRINRGIRPRSAGLSGRRHLCMLMHQEVSM